MKVGNIENILATKTLILMANPIQILSIVSMHIGKEKPLAQRKHLPRDQLFIFQLINFNKQYCN